LAWLVGEVVTEQPVATAMMQSKRVLTLGFIRTKKARIGRAATLV
jgi:hypothetical protein